MEWIDQSINYVTENADAGPVVIFVLLVFSGFNLPMSEDLLTFISASLAQTRPDLLWSLYFALYLGVLCGDSICYALGRFLGPKIAEIRFLSSMFSKERIERVTRFYARYGLITLVIGRFIPFGVRNGLFLAAGLGKMKFRQFIIADMLAAALSTGVYFWLYFHFAEHVVRAFQQSQTAIIGVVFAALVTWFLLHRRRQRSDKLNGS